MYGYGGGISVTETYVFELNETIHFDRENEIEEMLGVGLEPVITVEEFGEAISVRGVLELQGEYRKTKDFNHDANIESSFVDRVEPLSDDMNEFFHRFLLDISLPREKIRSIEDVIIEVKHFDYQLPSSNKMQIEATLEVQGLQPFRVENIEEQPEEEKLVSVDQDEDTDNNEEESFRFVYEHHDNEQKEHEVIPEYRHDVDSEPAEDSTVEANESRLTEENQERKVSETMPDHQEEELEFEQLDDSDRLEEEHRSLVEESAEDEELDEVGLEEREIELEEQEEVEEIFSVHGKSEQRDDASYLLNVFKQESEDERTRLTMYITQPDDNLNTIAEKYDVSTTKLARINRLEDDWIDTGQILYIPRKRT